MFRVKTQEEAEKQLLSQQCIEDCGTFFVSTAQIQPLIEMVRSITYEYFQTELPLIAKKVRELCLDALNMSFSLTLFRQIMSLIKKQAEIFAFHQNYLITMNRELSNSELFSPSSKRLIKLNEQNIEFQNVLQSKSSPIDFIVQAQLPIESKLQSKGDSNTEKSMQSQMMEVNNGSFVNSISKFSQFLRASNLSSFKEEKDKVKSDSSIQLEQFQKTGKDLMQNNIQVLIREQIVYDIRKNLRSVHKENKNAQKEHYRFNRQIKDCVMNSKLKIRRKK